MTPMDQTSAFVPSYPCPLSSRRTYNDSKGFHHRRREKCGGEGVSGGEGYVLLQLLVYYKKNKKNKL